jgi:DNA-binding response OmpR family regulator
MPSVIAEEKPKPAAAPRVTANILLVDDEKMVTDAIALVLQRAGHRVHCVEDGSAAWVYLLNDLNLHDLLILDINLPGIDGIELARRARTAGYVGKILMISGRLASTELDQFGGIAIDGVLPKPFQSEEIIAAVGRCLVNRKSRG